MELLNKENAINEANSITSDCYTIKLNTYNIIEVSWNNKIEEIDVVHLEHLRNSIKILGKGKRMLLYVDTYSFMSITPEASKYTTTEDAFKYCLANAVLIDSLPKKIIFNFYLKIYPPSVETKGFNTKEEALIWLKNINS
jgi:hypothetical protein